MRSTLDKLVSWMGLGIAVVLLAGGGLLTWAHNFIGNEVHQQLSAQQITMPGGAALATPDMKDSLGKYSGQLMTTGPQAKAYANHFILAHMNEASKGQTYAQVSAAQMAAAKADPNSAQTQQLTELKTTLFQGDTLRGLLLYGYAFATIGTIAGYAAIAAFIGAALMLALALFGLRHAALVRRDQPVASPRDAGVAVPRTA
ncbi:hypothetical protein [Calidifontibacter terrae]